MHAINRWLAQNIWGQIPTANIFTGPNRGIKKAHKFTSYGKVITYSWIKYIKFMFSFTFNESYYNLQRLKKK